MDGTSHEESEPKAVLDRLSEGVLALDSDLLVTYANEGALDHLEVDRADVVGTHLWEICPGAEESIAAEHIEQARTIGDETSYKRYNEQVGAWFDVSVYPDGGGLTVVFRDVTGRTERESELRQLHEATQELVGAASPEDVAKRASAAATEILGIEANGIHFYDETAGSLVPTAVSDGSRKLIGEAPALDEGIAWQAYRNGTVERYDDVRTADVVYDRETDARSELVVPLGDHGVFIFSASGTGVFSDDDVQVAKLLAKNTETVLSERTKRQQLRERDRELRQAEALFENAQDAFFIVDVDRNGDEYRIERVNPAYESLTGFTDAEIRDRSIGEIFDGDDRNAIRSHYDDCVERETPLTLLERLDVPVPDSYWETRIAPVVVDGDVCKIVGATRDITEQKAYQQRLEEQRDGLELLNEMVRHDIRNDLQVIASYAELLATQVSEADREYVERIRNNAETAVELTRSARDLAGTMLQTQESTEATPLRQTLLAQIDDIRTSYADAVVSVDGGIPSVAVDADEMLSSVFRNVIKNGIQHNDKPHPEVTVSVDVTDDRVRVSVVDNGPGIPDSQKADVFGRGQKGLESEGTGIGLYLVNTLVEKYGGAVHVDDNEPTGTVATIALERT